MVTSRIPKLLTAAFAATAIAACRSRPTVAAVDGVQWRCASPESDGVWTAALVAQDWTRRIVSDEGSKADALRKAYDLPKAKAGDVRIVRDPSICAQFGRAYAGNAINPTRKYAVALVRVGDRYVGITANAVQPAGEFWAWLITDVNFHALQRVAG